MSEATIANSTMIVACTFGLPRQSRKLKQEATQIETEKGANKGTVRASAFYFKRDPDKAKGESGKGEIDGLAPLKEFQTAYKAAVHALARYPYSGGFYIAPAGVVEELLLVKDKYDKEAAAIWMAWADDTYPLWLETAKARMGSMYNAQDFPTLTDCHTRFSAECTILPLADKAQVMHVTLISPKSKELLATHADATSKAAIEEMRKQIWTDLMAPIENVVTVFTKDKLKIHESLLENLMAIVNLVPSYDALAQDPKLMEAAAKAKEVFGHMTSEDLRESEDARKIALSSAKDIMAVYAPFARKLS